MEYRRILSPEEDSRSTAQLIAIAHDEKSFSSRKRFEREIREQGSREFLMDEYYENNPVK